MVNRLEQFMTVLSSVGGKTILIGDEDINDVYGDSATVLEGKIAVAENGCVWVPYSQEDRSSMFLAEHVMLVVDQKNIVADMHEAYDLISSEDYLYGCFMSGPSKTADIAQSLVMGAQAAVSLTVLIRK